MADSQRKTANLFDFDAWYTRISPTRCTVSKTGNSITITATGNDSYTGNGGLHVPVESDTEYTFRFTSDNDNSGSIYLFENGVVDSVHTHSFNNNNKKQVTFTTLSDTTFLTVRLGVYNSGNSITYSNIMLNSGSTALPYEPYGWVHSLRKLTTATDTITTLPVDLYADGTNATVGLLGNMQQTGTPTPQNPIQPSETGERTGNLFDKTDYVAGKYIDASGNEQTSSGAMNHSNYITVSANSEYTLSSNKPYFANVTYAIAWYDSNKTFISRDSWLAPDNQGRYDFTGTSPNNAAYAIVNFALYPSYANEQIMLNTGSEALPYEPYGYKLDIKSANTTTPVYLGEVETTRKIKKLVLTGEENWNLRTGEPSNVFFCSKSDLGITAIEGYGICSHYRYTTGGSFANLSDGEFIISPNNIGFRDTGISSAGAWIWYLQQQYANGTPVCVWYVLDTSETAVVNEPIRKIGDYADTVSGITIPTITGKDTFDVLTSLKPSEVSLAYTGWHDATVKEWDGSEWQ